MKKLFMVVVMGLSCIQDGAAQEEVSEPEELLPAFLYGAISMVSSYRAYHLIKSAKQWDKFFRTPLMSIVPLNAGQNINLAQLVDNADCFKLQERIGDLGFFLLLHFINKTSQRLSNDEDDTVLPMLALANNSIYGVYITAMNFKMIYDLINRYYITPVKSLIGKQCTSCGEQNRNMSLIVLCGDSRHCICVYCYTDRIDGADHYRCSLCRGVMPAQEITVRPRSLYDKVCDLSGFERRDICILLILQCMGVLFIARSLHQFLALDPAHEFLNMLSILYD